jgi:hypothetical protein
MSRVTRLGDFSTHLAIVYFGHFWKITELSHFWATFFNGEGCEVILTTYHNIGDFPTNASGRPNIEK